MQRDVDIPEHKYKRSQRAQAACADCSVESAYDYKWTCSQNNFYVSGFSVCQLGLFIFIYLSFILAGPQVAQKN